jgi:hypothetical protein
LIEFDDLPSRLEETATEPPLSAGHGSSVIISLGILEGYRKFLHSIFVNLKGEPLKGHLFEMFATFLSLGKIASLACLTDSRCG